MVNNILKNRSIGCSVGPEQQKPLRARSSVRGTEPLATRHKAVSCSQGFWPPDRSFFHFFADINSPLFDPFLASINFGTLGSVSKKLFQGFSSHFGNIFYLSLFYQSHVEIANESEYKCTHSPYLKRVCL